MKRILIPALCSAALLIGSAAPALSAVNCAMVKKDFDHGRSAQDISEKMGISVSEVNKCKEQAGPKTTSRSSQNDTNTAAPASNPNPSGKTGGSRY